MKCPTCEGGLGRIITDIKYQGFSLTSRGFKPDGTIEASRYDCTVCDFSSGELKGPAAVSAFRKRMKTMMGNGLVVEKIEELHKWLEETLPRVGIEVERACFSGQLWWKLDRPVMPRAFDSGGRLHWGNESRELKWPDAFLREMLEDSNGLQRAKEAILDCRHQDQVDRFIAHMLHVQSAIKARQFKVL